MATPLLAQITLVFSETELQALSGMLDAAVRAVGLRAVRDAATLLEKIDDAIKQAHAERSRRHE
jgi:hypothetical protein